MVRPFLPDDEKLPAIREALPATSAGIYLNAGSAGPLPRETARAMAELEGWQLRNGRGDPVSFEEMAARMDEARAAVAAVLTTDPGHVALTHGASEGMSIAAWSIDWRPGDRAVTTALEHPGGLGGLWSVRERLGIEIEVVEPGDGERLLDALERAIVPGTRLVAVSHVSWATGERLPVEEIVRLAHDRGALVAVDGAQAAGAIPVHADELGADFYALPGEKWLLGPEGIGAVHCAASVLDRVRTSFAGGFSFESFDLHAKGRLWPDARRFEGSNYNQASVLGLARSCAWISMYVGLPWIHERGARLAAAAHSMLATTPRVHVVTPGDGMAGLVVFRLAGWHAREALEELQRRVFVVARTIDELDAIRISVGFYNTDGELRRFGEAVELLAAHTPETLPRRPRIVMLEGGGE